MNKPVLSLDVSKGKSIAAMYLSCNEPVGKPFLVEHTRQGLGTLINELVKLEQKAKCRPEIIMEATGNYSKPIAQSLFEEGYSVITVNPLETHEQKRRSIRKIKTDKIDSHRIAQLYYMKQHDPMHIANPAIAEIKNLCRQYERLNVLYVDTQLRFRSIVDLLFPQYYSVFSELCNESSLRLIAAFPTPEAVLSAKKSEILKHIQAKYHRKEWPESIYQKLKAAAKTSLSYKVAQHSNIRVLREYTNILMTQRKVLDDIRAQIVAAAKNIPVYYLLRTIPGVGEMTAAVIIAEIGDVKFFINAKKLIAFAGLDPSVFESGTYKASKNRISKRGSNYLRKALFQATMSGICIRNKKPVNPVLYELYSRKVAEGKKKMVAIIAASSKLLRIVYGIWRNNEPFSLN